MTLIAVVLILIVWAILDIKEKLTPQNPPIEDIGEHLKTIQSLPNQKARQKYLKNFSENC